jgi:flagellar biosynthetic protein FliQ
MSSDQALELFANLLRTTMFVCAPLLLASLIAGVLVGIMQAATQINEASISFVAKVTAIMVVLVTIGPALASYAVGYARNSFQAVQHVVR